MPIHLGDLIDTLEWFPSGMPIQFKGSDGPLCFRSWRGDYSHLTLNFDSRTPNHTCDVAALLRAARDADGATFEGYKGGDFTMNLSTPVWADDYGDSYGWAVIGVVVRDGELFILTERQEYTPWA